MPYLRPTVVSVYTSEHFRAHLSFSFKVWFISLPNWKWGLESVDNKFIACVCGLTRCLVSELPN